MSELNENIKHIRHVYTIWCKMYSRKIWQAILGKSPNFSIWRVFFLANCPKLWCNRCLNWQNGRWTRLPFVTSVQWTMNGILRCCAYGAFGVKHISCEREMLNTKDPFAVARNCSRFSPYVPRAHLCLPYHCPPWIKMYSFCRSYTCPQVRSSLGTCAVPYVDR